jgi:hypothetical protein
MRLWSWIRGVIADRGEQEPVPIFLERGEDDEYVYRLGVRAGFGGQETARLPVQRRPNPSPHPILKEIHVCEVAGQKLEAANLYSLQAKVARQLETLAPGRSLPLCYFRVPAMDYELPVYEQGGELTSPVLSGPNLKARDLAGIRQVVCRYLISAGYVHDAEEVAVGVVRPRDLKLVQPAAVFRSHGDPDVWLPAVEGSSPDGPVVGIVGRPAQLRRPERRRKGGGPTVEDSAPAAPDVIALLRFLRTEFARAGASGAEGLYATEVRPEIWAAAEERTDDAGTRLVAYLTDPEATRLELGIRRTGGGDLAVALEDMGVNVFLAQDEDGLARQVGRHLAGDEFLRFAEEVEIHAAERPRAERLEAEAIRTNPQEEVQAAWS